MVSDLREGNLKDCCKILKDYLNEFQHNSYGRWLQELAVPYGDMAENCVL